MVSAQVIPAARHLQFLDDRHPACWSYYREAAATSLGCRTPRLDRSRLRE
jgi:hypothetical protein